ncbi:MAG: serpin family protein [Actinomycetota bacterium]|nr:serpin family protein [Actinomycetota bacterium]
MQRRTFLSLLALPAVAQFLQACGDGTGNGSPTVPGRSTVRGNALRATAGPDDAIQASAAINEFAQDLYDQLVAADPAANLVFSPASIAIALTMAAVGARGPTVDEMNAVLHIVDDGSIDRSMNGVATRLESVNRTRDNSVDGGDGTSEVQLSVANSLWGQSGLGFEQAFMEILSGEYDAGLELVDYRADPEAARGAINEWVATQTNDRIPQLLAEGTITTDSRLTLVNAIYLKANWDTVFPKADTAAEPFAAPTGEISVQMMHRSGEFGYAEGDGWQAIDIPYVFNELAFTVAMGTAADSVLPIGDELFPALTNRQVELGLPRFDLETSTDLVQVLTDMGMKLAFTDAADFSGITQAEALAIGAVIHQANITVDEEGTEAAAATAVIMVETSAPADEPIVLTIDRPFTFWLREVTTGTIVFMGRVNDPS